MGSFYDSTVAIIREWGTCYFVLACYQHIFWRGKIPLLSGIFTSISSQLVFPLAIADDSSAIFDRTLKK